jgi:exonuclease VII small subunit
MQLTKTIILKLDSPDNNLEELLSVFSQGMNYASIIFYACEELLRKDGRR